MNNKLANLLKTTRKFIGKHSPKILTGMGVVGMISTVVLAVKATPKAIELIETEKYDRKEEKLSTIDTVKVAWKPYVPAMALGTVSTACLIGASSINYKRNAALGAAYALSESTLIRYRDKVIDTIGAQKEKAIKNQVDQDVVNENKITNGTVIVTGKGNALCMDTLSGRYFRSDIDTIKKAINGINRRLVYDHYISLNEFYGEIGLDNVKNGSLLGWNLDNGLIEPTFSTCLAENDEPCIVIDYAISPKYDFDKLM